MYRTFPRYSRVCHSASGLYLNIIAPGPTPETVLVAERNGPAFPVTRTNLRTLNWFERLLNR